MNLPQSVRLTEVGPRDGLQNEARNLATADKVRLIRMLASAGIDEMEVTSFVSPKAVPNLADAEEVMEGNSRLRYTAHCSGCER
jgi:hydroxymethylglutaryl-CoA lyase